jgi:hypothetical protein
MHAAGGKSRTAKDLAKQGVGEAGSERNDTIHGLYRNAAEGKEAEGRKYAGGRLRVHVFNRPPTSLISSLQLSSCKAP